MHARAWLFSLETIGIKLGLSQITRLLEILGHPERAYRTVTVAGTNGKGSVTAMIERLDGPQLLLGYPDGLLFVQVLPGRVYLILGYLRRSRI